MKTPMSLATDPIGSTPLRAVLEEYHVRMLAERAGPRIEVRGGRDGGEDQRMRAIGPETGRLLHTIVASLSAPKVLEVGTSFGYSTLWLADAARLAGGHLTTIELHRYKSAYATDMAARAGLSDHIDFLVGDALELIPAFEGRFDFVFIDLWKDLYLPVLDAVRTKLNAGAIIAADNMIRPGSDEVRNYGRVVRDLPGVRSLLLPVGTGLEISILEEDDPYRRPAPKEI
ncbi:O-methyltransferase [Agrobacterium vitis]|uniref:O-methyltransferase n=1 Tax=Agrobacterium vitis TaxID=373 RepID=UPI0012E83F63|nr:class I SAM-dependent methyltransferase [Agrobacterium vitis]MVA37110.1 DUF1442 domain-containing protein [Agrobacterium vitis]